jgi:hypothetical protein
MVNRDIVLGMRDRNLVCDHNEPHRQELDQHTIDEETQDFWRAWQFFHTDTFEVLSLRENMEGKHRHDML